MKKFAIALSLVFAIALFAPLAGRAQDAGSQARPAAGAAEPAGRHPGLKMIWDYKKELEMSDGQEAGIKEAIQKFQTQVGDLRKQLEGTENNIQDLIEKKGDMDAIKTKLQDSADLQVQLRLIDIETARRIDSILTPYQLGLWHKIQQRELAKEEKERAAAEQPAEKPKKPKHKTEDR